MFSAYGPILDLVAMKTQKLKGQAFIVFADLSAAQNAKRDLNGRIVFGKDMQIQYAKKKSKVVSKMDGTYVESESASEEEKTKKKKTEPSVPAPTPIVPHPQAPVVHSRPPVASGRLPPNKVLFVQNLPENITGEQLTAVFSNCSGFKEVRIVPGNRGLAFVEFSDERQSGVAMSKFQNFRVENRAMYISFQKRVDT
eukprot:TRINITY_DN1751_c0_g1_i4.p1 TRINITY_DN1751_c0_g1~~TRINITY_DN1751_c0_g1_i4.p1  ORF type:complete len:197 (+),score=35.88 TRINITY_DN1751_c0_g1_i4:127-717(+)